jgi:hypothetical protein
LSFFTSNKTMPKFVIFLAVLALPFLVVVRSDVQRNAAVPLEQRTLPPTNALTFAQVNLGHANPFRSEAAYPYKASPDAARTARANFDRLRPAVIALSEVRDCTQAVAIAPSKYRVFCAKYLSFEKYGRRAQFEAVAVHPSIPVFDAGTVQVQGAQDTGAVWVEITWNERRLRVYSAHLASPADDRGAEMRLRQLDVLARHAATRHSIILGDFNLDAQNPMPWSGLNPIAVRGAHIQRAYKRTGWIHLGDPKSSSDIGAIDQAWVNTPMSGSSQLVKLADDTDHFGGRVGWVKPDDTLRSD